MLGKWYVLGLSQDQGCVHELGKKVRTRVTL
uniref:Uncharacterized protein n=1 Tax=Anguilla anguilla TaxID=7936 RepID=A0A0E9QBI9_ANGAN